MTKEEIDRWVEDHIKTPEDSQIRESAVEWGKLVAHKFYEQGRQDVLSLWEQVHELDDIYGFDSTQSADELVEDLKEILDNARKGNV